MLTDVPLAASNDDGKIVLQQEYSVEFQDVSNSPRNLANLINRSKSGNPGYIYGRPVLAGHAIAATSHLDAVSPRARGLQLLGADNDGTCTDAATERAKHPESRSLNVLHHYYKGHLIFWGGHAVRVSTSAKLQPGTRLLCAEALCPLRLWQTEQLGIQVGHGVHVAGNAVPCLPVFRYY